MTLARFSRRIRNISVEIQPNVNQLVRAIALQSLTTVSFATPVDTGRARSNWQVGIGSPVRTEIETYASGEPGRGDPSQRASNGAIAAQNAVVEGNAVIGRYNGVGDLYLSNNLDYIDSLNMGGSFQAPRNFVSDGINSAVQSVITSRRFRGIIR